MARKKKSAAKEKAQTRNEARKIEAEKRKKKQEAALKQRVDAFLEGTTGYDADEVLAQARTVTEALAATVQEKLLLLAGRKDYMKLWKGYGKTTSALSRLQKRQGSPEKEAELLAKQRAIAEQMDVMHKDCDLTQEFCEKEAKRLGHDTVLTSEFLQFSAEALWTEVQKILSGKAKMPQTPEQQYAADRTAHREDTPRHVIKAEADMPEDEKRRVASMQNEARIASNRLTRIMQVRLNALKGQKAYQELLQRYGKTEQALTRLLKEQVESEKETPDPEKKAPDSEKKTSDSKKKAPDPKILQLMTEKEEISEQMTAMQENCNVTWEFCRKQMEEIGKNSIVPSVWLLSAAEDVWKGVEAVLFRDGKRLHFRRKGDNPVLRGKQFDRCLVLKLVDGKLQFSAPLAASPATIHKEYAATLDAWNKERGPGSVISQQEKDKLKCKLKRTLLQNYTFGLKVKEKDLFLQDEIALLKEFLSDPDVERKAVEEWNRTGVPQNTFRPCYCSIRCETIRGKLRVWCYITVEGTPCPKKDKNGNPRHHYGTGDMGLDIGPQSFEAVTHTWVHAGNLAERDGHSTFETEFK